MNHCQNQVHNMLLSSWNWEDAKRVWQKEAKEDGCKEASDELFALLESGVSLAEAKRMLFYEK